MDDDAKMATVEELDTVFPKITREDAESGDWYIKNFTVNESEALMANLREIRDYGEQRRIYPGSYVGLYRKGAVVNTTVMSDTYAEKRDHYTFVRFAKGKVLVNGLGLGMVAEALLRKDSVERVVVVEKSRDVISLVSPYFSDDPRIQIIEGDALELGPKDYDIEFDAVWHDIWDYANADTYSEMDDLIGKWMDREGKRFIGCWCFDEAEENHYEEELYG